MDPYRTAASGPTPEDEGIAAGVCAFVAGILQVAAKQAQRERDDRARASLAARKDRWVAEIRGLGFVVSEVVRDRLRVRGVPADAVKLERYERMDRILPCAMVALVATEDDRLLAEVELPEILIRRLQMRDPSAQEAFFALLTKLVADAVTALETPAVGEIELGRTGG